MAEVEQADVFVCLVAFRIGSIDTDSGKSYTQLEYGHAVERGKKVLIYLVDEAEAKVRYADIDTDQTKEAKLRSFKGILRERHTIDTFVEPSDLVEKLRRDLSRYFEPKATDEDDAPNELDHTAEMVTRFLLMPKTVLGREGLFVVKFRMDPYPASRSLCRAFNLDYGQTVGVAISVSEPRLSKSRIVPFNDLYASGRKADQLVELASTKDPVHLYARLQFSQEDVPIVRGHFFEYHDEPDVVYPGEEYWVPAAGKAILLFSKTP